MHPAGTSSSKISELCLLDWAGDCIAIKGFHPGPFVRIDRLAVMKVTFKTVKQESFVLEVEESAKVRLARWIDILSTLNSKEIFSH